MIRGLARFASLIACTALVACSKQTLQPDAGIAHYHATIRWTAHGVPHVRANDWASLGYGTGYAIATDGVCILAREFVTVRGEQAKYFGPAEGRREADIFHKAITAAAIGVVTRSPAQMQSLLDGYVAGYNRYLADHPGDKLPARCRNQPWVRPIDRTDMARMSAWVSIRNGIGRGQVAIAQASPPTGAVKGARAVISPLPFANDTSLLGSNAIAWARTPR